MSRSTIFDSTTSAINSYFINGINNSSLYKPYLYFSYINNFGILRSFLVSLYIKILEHCPIKLLVNNIKESISGFFLIILIKLLFNSCFLLLIEISIPVVGLILIKTGFNLSSKFE